jgi:hypothetical protein
VVEAALSLRLEWKGYPVVNYVVVRFTCEHCKETQEIKLTWRPSTRPSNPAVGQKELAEVTCGKCDHKQVIAIRP